MTPEGKVKEAIKQLLKRHGAYYFMPVQYGYGAATVDFLVCHRGQFAAIEAKAPGKKPTPRQRLALEDIEVAGGNTFVVDGEDSEGMLRLAAWLKAGWGQG